MDFDSVLIQLETTSTVAVDIETTGFDPWRGDRVMGVSLAIGEWSTYVPVSHPDSPNISAAQYKALLDTLARVPLLVFHNHVFDLSFLSRDGLTWNKLHDTMVFAWLQDEN